MENNEYRSEDLQDRVEVPTPWGPIKAYGRGLLKITLAILLIVGLFVHDRNQEERDRALLSSFKTMIYVLSLGQEERKQLNLSEPQEIRDLRRSGR